METMKLNILGLAEATVDLEEPGDRSRNKIDYIIIQKRFRNAVKTSMLLPGANCDSDHIPLMCKFQIIPKKLRKAKANPKFPMHLLKSDEKLKDKIAVAVHNKYETLENISEVEEMEERCKSKNLEAKYKDLNRNIKIRCNAAKEE
ncbi:RNA-directed DNA polymerase from mobile element jockey [Plakobranchus ocellatus]|uniref:RNA-directed DNA polymerase from mobile element jockey n=1 Tax=Plakobranchus ocellatus TaxID=259542 RepID=A0AAV4B3K1_9GAST|nr:RNA-directed DNA polymerase from mobile element jockey [Plakobranchus ocellatus]